MAPLARALSFLFRRRVERDLRRLRELLTSAPA
jgi:hypothetical protein